MLHKDVLNVVWARGGAQPCLEGHQNDVGVKDWDRRGGLQHVLWAGLPPPYPSPGQIKGTAATPRCRQTYRSVFLEDMGRARKGGGGVRAW